MLRLFVGVCALALAVVAVRADDEKKKDEKTTTQAFKALFQELVTKYQTAKTDKAREELLASYGDKFVDLASKAKKDEDRVMVLVSVAGIPIPAATQAKVANGLKGVIDKSEDEKVRNKALPAYVGLQSRYIQATTDAKAVESAKKDLEKYAGKYLEVAKKNVNTAAGVSTLAQLVGLPLPLSKDGVRAKAAELLKKIIKDGEEKSLRVQAITAYMTAQGSVITSSKDAEEIAAARKEMDAHRKILAKDFKDDIKDLFIGATMPELKSQNLEGKDVKLSDLKGKVVVLDIWATWCGPCRAMIPHERELVAKLKAKPFVLVSISADAKKETLTDFLEKNPMPWTHWWDGQRGKIGTELSVRYYPTIYVLDGKGKIRYKDVRGKQMDEAVETLLKEVEDKTKGKD